MPVLIIVVLAIVAIIWVSSRRNQRRRPLRGMPAPRPLSFFRRNKCRWTSVAPHKSGLTEFRCETCKVTAYSYAADGPTECKRALRSAL